MINVFGIWPYVGYAFALFFVAMAFYYCGIKGKLILMAGVAASVGIPWHLRTESAVRMGLVAIICLGVASAFYLKHRGVFD